MRKISTVLMVLAVITAVTAQHMVAQDDSTAARIERLEQQVRINDRLLEIWRDSVNQRFAAAPVITAGAGGFIIRSADGAYSLRIRALVHGDARFYMGNSLRPATNLFLLRRVRSYIEATFAKNYSMRIMPDFAGSVVVLQDAYMDARFSNAIQLRGGKFKAPFGLERLVSSTTSCSPSAVSPPALPRTGISVFSWVVMCSGAG